jgi:hypothetical protein
MVYAVVARYECAPRDADRASFDAHAASAHFAEHIVGTVRPLLTERTVFFAEPLA